MKSHLFRLVILLAAGCTSFAWALGGTKGTPLGGMGTGYVVFNAVTGQMAAVTKVMPAGSEGESEFTN
jgi:hypothetical protein